MSRANLARARFAKERLCRRFRFRRSDRKRGHTAAGAFRDPLATTGPGPFALNGAAHMGLASGSPRVCMKRGHISVPHAERVKRRKTNGKCTNTARRRRRARRRLRFNGCSGAKSGFCIVLYRYRYGNRHRGPPEASLCRAVRFLFYILVQPSYASTSTYPDRLSLRAT